MGLVLRLSGFALLAFAFAMLSAKVPGEAGGVGAAAAVTFALYAMALAGIVLIARSLRAAGRAAAEEAARDALARVRVCLSCGAVVPKETRACPECGSEPKMTLSVSQEK
ncbi:MAG TPA: hypothetical protein VNZ52_00455 [Candidatus Thermoplasmatota archaeon]|nr:hypothetical protein [Candidatus Thermoplasmatota archaeon]